MVDMGNEVMRSGMKARLYVRSSERGKRSYSIVVRGVLVGMLYRFTTGWAAYAFLLGNDGQFITDRTGFIRRGDAKRWVIHTQTLVANRQKVVTK